jgi:hypothetical protein
LVPVDAVCGWARLREDPPMGSARGDTKQDRKVRRFVRDLGREERMLLVLKRELYEGSWDDMEADLRARLEGRPYIFKLVNRISEDLERINRLRAFEEANTVDLSEHVRME